AFMLRYTSGVICVPMTGARLDALHIPMMVPNNPATFGTAFTVSVDAREGVTTGISAADRAQAIQVLASPDAKPYDLVMPGHIYPLRAREGGVLVRAGQTEASVDLCRLGGLNPVAAICELMNPDGTMMRLPQLRKFAAKHDLKIISVAELIRHRTQRERLVERVAATVLPTKWGDFTLYAYRSSIDPDEHEQPRQARRPRRLRPRSRRARPHHGHAQPAQLALPRDEARQARPLHRHARLGRRVLYAIWGLLSLMKIAEITRTARTVAAN